MKEAITDLGATQIFIKEGTLIINKRPTTCPLVVSLSDGSKVTSAHMCNIHINGCLGILTGHIIPELSIASLFGIAVLTKAGCKVHFDKSVCTVWHNNRIILKGGKDKATNIWMLPIGTNPSMSSHHNTVATPLMAPININAYAQYATMQIAFFTHTVRTKANSIQFTHQSLCSPPISTLLKTIKRGFLKGCPNLSAAGVTRYLNPSPATHQKCKTR
jgi:hypothetical protein